MFIISVHEKCIFENFPRSTFYAFEGGKNNAGSSNRNIFFLFSWGVLNINKIMMGWVAYVKNVNELAPSINTTHAS